MKRTVRRGAYSKQPKHVMRSANPLIAKWQDWKLMSKRQKIAVLMLPVLLVLIVIPLLTYIMLARDISDPERLMNRSNTGVQLIANNGEVFFSTDRKSDTKRLSLGEISDWMEKALISSEDKKFYEHAGVSFLGIFRSIVSNVLSRDATGSGGSTLTQQLVKNTLLSSEKSFFRKYQEASMAVAVERTYTKDEILDMYLNSIYYGEGAFGIDEASKVYFGKSAADLTLAESAMLVGVLPAPSAYSPISGDSEKAKKQQSLVLRRMVEDGKITQEQKTVAENEQLVYAPVQEEERTVAPHFVEMVMSQLYEQYGEERVKRSGYKVQTTLNIDWQRKAETIVSNQTAINSSGGGRNASLVALDPKTGAVRALVGSVDYANEDFGKVNMATTARQPGSSFKPIYITEAIHRHMFTAASVIKDEATDFNGYKPNNYDFKWRGDITLRNALAQSLNIPAVKVMEKLGVRASIEKARQMGLSTISPNVDYGLSLALGSAEVTPLAMTSAYSSFANQGKQYEVGIIDSIKSKYDDMIYKRPLKSTRTQSSEASFIISDILSDNSARAPSFGSRLNIPGHKVAVKTGSTDNNHDAWTIGYTPSIVVGVWVGNNENVAMTGGGSGMAGPIWSKAITAFLADSEREEFPQPSSVVKASACNASGSGTIQEFFIRGTQPNTTCQKPATPSEDDNSSEDDKDADRDGTPDKDDICPTIPGPESNDGCPAAATSPSLTPSVTVVSEAPDEVSIGSRDANGSYTLGRWVVGSGGTTATRTITYTVTVSGATVASGSGWTAAANGKSATYTVADASYAPTTFTPIPSPDPTPEPPPPNT